MSQKSYHTQATRETNKTTTEQHIKAMQEVMDEVLGMLSERSTDYDNLRTFVERMPFGDVSWATMIFIKADRLCSSLAPDIKDVDDARVDDSLIDLIVYAIAYRAWRNILKDEKAEELVRHQKWEQSFRDNTIFHETEQPIDVDKHTVRIQSDDGKVDIILEKPVAPPIREAVSTNAVNYRSDQTISAGEAAARSLVDRRRISDARFEP